MSAALNLRMKVRLAWWVRPYIWSVALFARMTGLQPDADRVAAFAKRGIKVEVSGRC